MHQESWGIYERTSNHLRKNKFLLQSPIWLMKMKSVFSNRMEGNRIPNKQSAISKGEEGLFRRQEMPGKNISLVSLVSFVPAWSWYHELEKRYYVQPSPSTQMPVSLLPENLDWKFCIPGEEEGIICKVTFFFLLLLFLFLFPFELFCKGRIHVHFDGPLLIMLAAAPNVYRRLAFQRHFKFVYRCKDSWVHGVSST